MTLTLNSRHVAKSGVCFCSGVVRSTQHRKPNNKPFTKQLKFSFNPRFQKLIPNVSSNTLQRSDDSEEITIKPQINTWQQKFLQNPQNAFQELFEQFGLTPRIRGLILLNILTLLMATNWVVVKESELRFDPFTFAMLRFGVASVALLPFVKNTINNKKIWMAGAELGFWSAIGYMTQAIGLMETDASRASLISTFTVILVPVLAGLSGRGVKPLTWGAGLVAILGVSMLEEGGGQPPNMGDLWSLISAAGFALQIYRTEIISRGECGKNLMQLLVVTVFSTFFLSAVTAGVMHPQSVWDTIQCVYHGTMDNNNNFVQLFQNCPLKEVIYTGLLTTDAVLLIEMFALHDVSSVQAAIIYTMEPVLGAGLAYWFLGERGGPMGWVGAGLILASSLGAQVFGEETEDKKCDQNDEQLQSALLDTKIDSDC